MRYPAEFELDQRGNVAVLFGLTSLAMFGMAGAAVDFGRAYNVRSELQSSADAAALAGAKLGGQATSSARISAASSVFTANISGVPAPGIVVNGETVTVTAAMNVPTALLGVVGITELPVNAKSVASSVTSPPSIPPTATCVLLLQASQVGLYVNSESKLDATCGLHVNSNHSTEALFANSSSHITTTSTCVRGEARLSSGSTATPTPVEGCAVKPDPLLSLAEPSNAAASCNHTDFKVENGQTKTMSPGVYCKKTLINSGGTATMQPGVYIFRQGEFLVNSQSTVTGSQVMMFFVDKDARLNVNSDGVFKVSAPKSGTYQGMLMFQGRHHDNSSAPPFIVNSDGNTRLEGTIYLPKGTLEVNSWSTANQLAAYTAIVADKMVLNSNGTLKIKSDYTTNTPLPPLLASAMGTTTISARLTQ